MSMGFVVRELRDPARAAPSSRLHSIATWTVLVAGSAAPMTRGMWPLWNEAERSGVIAGIAVWVLLVFGLERLLTRSGSGDAARFLKRGVTIQLLLTWALAFTPGSEGLVLMYLPGAVLLVPLAYVASLLPQTVGMGV